MSRLWKLLSRSTATLRAAWRRASCSAARAPSTRECWQRRCCTWLRGCTPCESSCGATALAASLSSRRAPKMRMRQSLLPGSTFQISACVVHAAYLSISATRGNTCRLVSSTIVCRQELRTRLLSLFADFGSLVQAGGRHQDLGALLPVIAASSEGLHAMGGTQSAHSMSFDQLTSLKEEDANTIKVAFPSNHVSYFVQS